MKVKGVVVYVSDPRTHTAHPLHMDQLCKSGMVDEPDKEDADPDFEPENRLGMEKALLKPIPE